MPSAQRFVEFVAAVSDGLAEELVGFKVEESSTPSTKLVSIELAGDDTEALLGDLWRTIEPLRHAAGVVPGSGVLRIVQYISAGEDFLARIRHRVRVA